MSRSLRRHHRERMKAKARRIVKIWNAGVNNYKLPEDFLVANADHLKTCSCWMCGNPRKHWGKSTLQEIRLGPWLKNTSNEPYV